MEVGTSSFFYMASKTFRWCAVSSGLVSGSVGNVYGTTQKSATDTIQRANSGAASFSTVHRRLAIRAFEQVLIDSSQFTYVSSSGVKQMGA
jgi:hypothetical protein